MSEWKDYIIFCFGEQVDCETARSKKEACDLYVKECKRKYIEDNGYAPTIDMIKDAYENIEAIALSDID